MSRPDAQLPYLHQDCVADIRGICKVCTEISHLWSGILGFSQIMISVYQTGSVSIHALWHMFEVTDRRITSAVISILGHNNNNKHNHNKQHNHNNKHRSWYSLMHTALVGNVPSSRLHPRSRWPCSIGLCRWRI